MSQESTKNIRRYYANKETLWGYKFVLRDAKHLGYYPDKTDNISVAEAEKAYHDLLASKLQARPGYKILDAGCGRGVVACDLAKRYGFNITGIDILDFELASAKQRAIRSGVTDRTRFLLGDYTKTGLPKESFDAVYANETLSHCTDLENLESALREFHRLLKPGGSLTLFEYKIADDQEFNPSELAMLNLVIERTAVPGLRCFRKNTVLSLLEKCGYDQFQEEDVSAGMMPSFERFYRLAKPVYPFIKLLRLQKIMINTTIAVEWYPIAKKGLIKYFIFTAKKPT